MTVDGIVEKVAANFIWEMMKKICDLVPSFSLAKDASSTSSTVDNAISAKPDAAPPALWWRLIRFAFWLSILLLAIGVACFMLTVSASVARWIALGGWSVFCWAWQTKLLTTYDTFKPATQH